MNASNSITPSKGERLADNQPKLQWTNIDWEMVKEHVNRLQTRIAKAVKQLLPDTERVMRRLSGMRSKSHVPFLEEGERVIALSYSAPFAVRY